MYGQDWLDRAEIKEFIDDIGLTDPVPIAVFSCFLHLTTFILITTAEMVLWWSTDTAEMYVVVKPANVYDIVDAVERCGKCSWRNIVLVNVDLFLIGADKRERRAEALAEIEWEMDEGSDEVLTLFSL